MRTWRDPEVINRLLTTQATWAVVGLSANTERTAYRIAKYLRDRLGMSIVPVNLREKAQMASEQTVAYVKDEPVKSMLIAAATGALLMGLVSLLGRSRD